MNLKDYKRDQFYYAYVFGTPITQLSDGRLDAYEKIIPIPDYKRYQKFNRDYISGDYPISLDAEWQTVGENDILVTLSCGFFIDGVIHVITFHNRKYEEVCTVPLGKLFLWLNKKYKLNLGVFCEPHKAHLDDKGKYKKRTTEYRKSKVEGQETIRLIGHFNGVDIRFTDVFVSLNGRDDKHSNNNCVQVLHKQCMAMNHACCLNSGLWDPHRNEYEVYMNVRIRDTMLLLPDKTSLDRACKDFLHTTKLDNINDDEITNMAIHLYNNPDRYAEYAIKDAYTTLQLTVVLAELYKCDCITLPGIALTKYLDSLNLAKKSDYKFIRGYDFDEETRTYFPLDKDGANPEILEICELMSREDVRIYKGGCNQCYTYGLTNAKTIDVDLQGAYTTAMISVPKFDLSEIEIIENTWIKDIPDHENRFSIENICTFGVAEISYIVPENVIITEPNYTAKNDVFYTQNNNNVAVCYPTLVQLYQNNCEIYIHKLRIPKQDGTPHPLSNYVTEKSLERLNAKMNYGKGSVQELSVKFILNTLYGKMGQGVNKKNIKEFYGDDVSALPHNAISDPLVASHVTSMTRAIIGLIINYLKINKGGMIYSTTTDGFITNATNNDIKDVEDWLKSFKSLKRLLDIQNLDSFTTVKHTQYTLYNFKTRFGISGLTDTKGVLATVGMKFNKRNMENTEKKRMIIDKINKNEIHFENPETNLESLKVYKDASLKSIQKQVAKTVRLFHDARMIPHSFDKDYGILLRFPLDYGEYLEAKFVHEDICHYEYMFDFRNEKECLDYLEIYKIALNKRRRYKIKDIETWCYNEIRMYRYYNDYSLFKGLNKDEFFNKMNRYLRNAKFKILTQKEFDKMWKNVRKSESIDPFFNKYNVDEYLRKLKEELNNKRSKQRRKQTTP